MRSLWLCPFALDRDGELSGVAQHVPCVIVRVCRPAHAEPGSAVHGLEAASGPGENQWLASRGCLLQGWIVVLGLVWIRRGLRFSCLAATS